MSGYGGSYMSGYGYSYPGSYGTMYGGYSYPSGGMMSGYTYPEGGYISGYGYPEGTVIEGTRVETGREGVRSPTRTDEGNRNPDRNRNAPGDRQPRGTDRETPEKEVSGPSPARIIVTLPADATLTVDGTPTTSKSGTRVFVSPALQPGQDYHYDFKAEVMRNGERLSTTKHVAVRAGQETRVQIDLPAGTVAQR
jgi:uncharacterized protein (TIGR03000 family)